jgi:hypothetical protein
LHHICERCIKGKHQRTSFPKDGATRASHWCERANEDYIAWWSAILSHIHWRLLKENSFLFFKGQKEKRLKNSNNIRRWWKMKSVTKSKCYDRTTKKNLCLRSLTHFL